MGFYTKPAIKKLPYCSLQFASTKLVEAETTLIPFKTASSSIVKDSDYTWEFTEDKKIILPSYGVVEVAGRIDVTRQNAIRVIVHHINANGISKVIGSTSINIPDTTTRVQSVIFHTQLVEVSKGDMIDLSIYLDSGSAEVVASQSNALNIKYLNVI